MQQIIFYYWKNTKIPEVPSSVWAALAYMHSHTWFTNMSCFWHRYNKLILQSMISLSAIQYNYISKQRRKINWEWRASDRFSLSLHTISLPPAHPAMVSDWLGSTNHPYKPRAGHFCTIFLGAPKFFKNNQVGALLNCHFGRASSYKWVCETGVRVLTH